MQAAACIKSWNNAEVFFLDAIAENKDKDDCLDHIKIVEPDFVISITGIESIESDLKIIDYFKHCLVNVMFAVFGYYPTIFPREILSNSKVDLILRNEPEETLSLYLKAWEDKAGCAAVPGIAYRDVSSGIVVTAEPERIQDLDRLPYPDYGMIDKNKYSEMLVGGPLGVIQSSRGCPFGCTYCITSHGRQLVFKSADKVVDEMANLKNAGIKYIRFIDDTFNVDKKRVAKICTKIIEKNIGIKWTCLSRVDTLDKDVLDMMKKAGCVRVYVGIESYSQKTIDYFKKGYICEEINNKLKLINKAGLESVGFIMVGLPFEKKEEFLKTASGIMASDLDLLIVTKIVPYPGTPMFEKEEGRIDFSLFPYASDFKEKASEEEVIEIEKSIYRRFYFRPMQMFRLFRIFMRAPRQGMKLFISFLLFVFKKKENKEHPDFL